jgi:nitrogen regulatory protein P-II 1
MITAIVKPEKLDDLMQAVTSAGARGLTVTEVRGFGEQYGHQAAVHPDDPRILVLPKLRVDVVVQDQAARPVADSIAKSVNTGTIGDGKIWVCPWTACCGSGPASATLTRYELSPRAAACAALVAPSEMLTTPPGNRGLADHALLPPSK